MTHGVLRHMLEWLIETGRGWEWTLGVWRRRKWLGAFVLALVGTATICIVTFLPDVYQSTATVLIDRPQVADVFVRPSVTGEQPIGDVRVPLPGEAR